MKPARLLPVAALAILLSTAGAVYAQDDAGSGPPPSPPPPAGNTEHGMKHWHHHNELMDLLPEDKQKMLKDAFEKTKKDEKESFEQGRKLHEELDAIMKAPKFDEDAFLKKSDEINELHTKMWQSHLKVIADVATKFTPEERRVLVVMGHMMMKHQHPGGEWGHSMHHHPEHGPDHGPEHSPDHG